MIPVIYWMDALYFSVIILIIVGVYSQYSEQLRLRLRSVLVRARYAVALVFLTWFALLGFLDSLHFKESAESSKVQSVLDKILSPRNSEFEITYSAPFALYAYNKEIIKTPEGHIQEIVPRLKYAGQHLKNPDDKSTQIWVRIFWGVTLGVLLTGMLYLWLNKKISTLLGHRARKAFWLSLGSVLGVTAGVYLLMFDYHVLGTNKIGQDVFYVALKSIRTGLLIGTVTTLVMLPFALMLGMWAGYFRGVVDDIIQYIYTTLSSVPAVLLIAAAVLSIQSKLGQSPELRLLILCLILGVTSWTSLCRLLRGETLKLRESEYVQAALTLGVSHFKIIFKHIMPNLLHIVIITVALDFSGLVLAEAVLSFIGVGVDPTTFSFGNMINAARLEMARDPVVWWSLSGAFILMFALVFSANIVADAVQELFDPRRF